MANKKLGLAGLALATAALTTAPVKQAQAGLITTTGDQGSTLNLELNENKYNITLNSTYDFELLYIPFLTSDDAAKVTANFNGIPCVVNSNYILCDFLTPNNSISGYFTASPGYEFREFERPGNNFFFSASLNDFESFYANIPSIEKVTTQNPTPQVSAPMSETLVGLGLAGILAANRRRKKNN